MVNDYWKGRIEAEQKAKIERGATLKEEMDRMYNYHFSELEKEIRAFEQRYADKNNLPLSEIKARVNEIDVKAFEERAKRYVAEKDFSARANSELALYNLKMKTNRLELLQYQLDLEMVALADKEHKMTERFLSDEYVQTLKTQSGLLGRSVLSASQIENVAQAAINTSLKGAVWSDRIWDRQDALRVIVARMTEDYLLKGKNPTTMIGQIRKEFGVSASKSRSLAVTEGARVATEAERQSYLSNGYDEYEYIAEPSACDICAKLDGNIIKVKDMEPGKNAAPMHPNCHCSTAAHFKEDDEYEKLIRESSVSKQVTNDENVQTVDNYGTSGKIIYKDADEQSLKLLVKQSNNLFKNKLLGDETNALNEYSGVYYGIINRHLRNDFWIEDADNSKYYNPKDVIKILDRALDKDVLGQDLKLYRYTDYKEFFNIQNQDMFQSYLSTSVYETATQHLGDYKVVINAPKTTKGIYLGDYSEIGEEREFLVHRNAKYKVLEVDLDNGTIEVELYE